MKGCERRNRQCGQHRPSPFRSCRGAFRWWQTPGRLCAANPGLSDVLTDRVKYHDLYLSTGCCSYAVNAVLKPLYPLSEDLQYSGPHASRSALKLHYQQPSRLSITHITSFHQKPRSADAVPSHVSEVPRSSPVSRWHCRWLLLRNIWIY